MNVKILPRPVMGLYRIDGNMFIRQQRRQVFACCAADGKDGRGAAAKKSDGSRNVNSAPPGSNTGRYSVVCLPGKFAGSALRYRARGLT
jgi:hypothetical protein